MIRLAKITHWLVPAWNATYHAFHIYHAMNRVRCKPILICLN